MGKCYHCKHWKRAEGSLEKEFFGECTNEKIGQINPDGQLSNIGGAGYQAKNVKGFKFITGKNFGCNLHDPVHLSSRPWYTPQKKSKVPYVKVTLTNETHGTEHVVRAVNGELSHAQVYNSKRDLCWPNDSRCTCDSDPAGCVPQQVQLIKKGKTMRENRYRILKKYIKPERKTK